MRRHFIFVLLLPIALLAQTGATVDGTVIDRTTREGLPEATVALFTDNGANYKATTDASGRFRIPDVPPGAYWCRYMKSGFESVDIPRIEEGPIRIKLGGTYHLDGEIARLAAIQGRVLDPDGKPVSGIKVQLQFLSRATDSEGRFAFEGLYSGSYTLRAMAGGTSPESDQLPRSEVVDTYFPSALDEADAQRITVRTGGPDIEGLDIHLRRSAVFRIAGVVLDEKDKPVPAVTVRLFRPSKGRPLAGMLAWAGAAIYLNVRDPEPEGPTVATDKDGHFEFPAVRPGDWLLAGDPRQRSDSEKEAHVTTGMVPVRVSESDVSGLELRFEPGFPLEVKRDWGSSKPPEDGGPGPLLLFSANGGMALPPPAFAPDGTPRLDPGQFRMVTRFEHVLPGRYQIIPGIGGAEGFYAAAVLLDGRDVSGQDFELTASSAVSVVYKPNPGSVRGTVEKGEGAHVLLWPQGAGIPYSVPTVVAGAHGEFEFHNVAPGSYAVVAFDRINQQGAAPDYVPGVVANAPQVRVEELGTAMVNVPLTQWTDR